MKQVFIVDDHSLFRQLLAVVLEQLTDLKESVQAQSLTEARQALSDIGDKIDLAIVDLDMPDGDAPELIKELRDAQPDVPVLAFTVGRNFQVRDRALQAGANQVLSTASPGKTIVRAAELLVGGQ
jgi:DNA-binding NarL/FixJ family response regulator